MDKIDLNKLDILDNDIQSEIVESQNKSRRNILKKFELESEESKKREKKVKPVSFAISFDLDEKIEQYCNSRHMKKSTFAVLALEEYLKKVLADSK
ncbi:hypothetical protein [Paenibacillus cremeus]|uniref:Uncharacterized protein n=1 Tax=Paenibacillus cremeus TaxID=2163881 RepID=A0A559K5G3_9BACL|nr:hypothetical protein [Paenibacillus cremeus]TVY07337.1 hypothetical protein FPZ49_24665 [Paenibacillus cremeus]